MRPYKPVHVGSKRVEAAERRGRMTEVGEPERSRIRMPRLYVPARTELMRPRRDEGAGLCSTAAQPVIEDRAQVLEVEPPERRRSRIFPPDAVREVELLIQEPEAPARE